MTYSAAIGTDAGNGVASSWAVLAIAGLVCSLLLGASGRRLPSSVIALITRYSTNLVWQSTYVVSYSMSSLE